MPLLERDAPLSVLRAAVDRARRGEGCVVLVAGEAGIGKTALVEHFAREAGGRVLWGACDALATPRPLGPLHDMARAVQEEWVTLLGGDAARDRLFPAVLGSIGGAHTILVIEDAHWADEATLDFVRFLGRRIARLPAVLLLTYRDDEVAGAHPLRVALGHVPAAAVRRLTLSPLSEEAVLALARGALRSGRGLHAITGGNPFFVTEMLIGGSGTVPSSVRDAVLARVARLPASVREVLEAASIVPARIEQGLLRVLVPDGDAAIAQCVDARLLLQSGDAWSFRHELARRAIEDEIPAARARALHRAMLGALRAAPPGAYPSARVAYHAVRAGDDDVVLAVAPRAAEEAKAVGAHREAAAHYADALRGAARLPPRDRAALFDAHAYECFLTDRIEDSVQSRLQALSLWRSLGDTLREGDALRWLSRLSWFLGRKQDADRYAREAVALLEHAPPSHELAMACSTRAQLAMLEENAPEAVRWGDRAIALAEDLSDEEPLVHALNNVGTARWLAGDRTGEEMLRRSLALSLAGDRQEHVARAYTNLASCCAVQRTLADAEEHLRAGIAYCEERDLDSWTIYMRTWRAIVALEQGHMEHAFDEAIAVIGDAFAPPVSRIGALVVLARVRARRGEPDVASVLAEARELAERTGESQRITLVAVGDAEAAWIAGADPQRALEALAAAFDRARPTRNAWACGELAAWSVRLSGPNLASLSGDAPVAEPCRLELAGEWRAAARFWRACGSAHEEAVLLATSGDDEDAARESLAAFERMGATASAAAARRVLRARGVRGVPRGQRDSTRKNPARLTARQMDILRLLTEGLSNAEIADRLFVSAKTVDHHVSAVLTKLEVRTRGEAAAAARAGNLID